MSFDFNVFAEHLNPLDEFLAFFGSWTRSWRWNWSLKSLWRTSTWTWPRFGRARIRSKLLQRSAVVVITLNNEVIISNLRLSDHILELSCHIIELLSILEYFVLTQRLLISVWTYDIWSSIFKFLHLRRMEVLHQSRISLILDIIFTLLSEIWAKWFRNLYVKHTLWRTK